MCDYTSPPETIRLVHCTSRLLIDLTCPLDKFSSVKEPVSGLSRPLWIMN